MLAPLPAPPLALSVSAGALEPHPLIRATMAIRVRAARGPRFLLMCSPAVSDFQLTSRPRPAATGSQKQRLAIAASDASGGIGRTRRGDRPTRARRGDGLDQLLGGLARRRQDQRRVAALPLP